MGKVLMLNSKTLEFTEVEIENKTVSLEEMYKNIGCDSVEHVSGYNQRLDDLHVGMWIDEMGKLKENWESDISVAIVNKDYKAFEFLVGNIMFTSDDLFGDTFGLTDYQIEQIKQILFASAYLNLKPNNQGKMVRVLRYY